MNDQEKFPSVHYRMKSRCKYVLLKAVKKVCTLIRIKDVRALSVSQLSFEGRRVGGMYVSDRQRRKEKNNFFSSVHLILQQVKWYLNIIFSYISYFSLFILHVINKRSFCSKKFVPRTFNAFIRIIYKTNDQTRRLVNYKIKSRAFAKKKEVVIILIK